MFRKRKYVILLIMAAVLVVCCFAACEPTQSTVRTVDFYAINDFHGKVDRMSTVAGYLTEQRNSNANTVFISSGDMFQGSMESNSNYGSLLSQCMTDVGFDAFVFGNHEFDWGLDNLAALANKSEVPFIGANIYHWDAATKTWGTFADELAKEYTVKTLDNGLNVGIIGVIGKDQITSISSQLVQTIGFKNPSEVIPSISEKLKNQLDCDVVVVSAHTDADTFLDDNSWDITQYCDAVFCAHSHQEEVHMKNGVPFIQGGSYGKYVSHVQLEVSPQGAVTCKVKDNVPYSDKWPNKFTVSELIDNSNEQIAAEANNVLATTDGSLYSNEEMPRIVCNAIADYAAENYPSTPIALAMVNNARSTINVGEITYSELYTAIPFDNTVYIARVSGRDILKEAQYGNFIWRVSEEPIINSDSAFYNIAVIDYLLFHQDADRNYNYFRSAFTGDFAPIPLNNDNYPDGMYNYRLITRDWLLEQQKNGNVISRVDYNGVNSHTNTTMLEQKVTLSDSSKTEPMHAGTADDPYTVTNAAELANGVTSAENAAYGYLKATVCQVQNAVFFDNGAVRNVYVQDEYGNMLQLFGIDKASSKNEADNNWNQENFELNVGDEVVLYGWFITYRNTVEITKGWCVSINGVLTE